MSLGVRVALAVILVAGLVVLAAWLYGRTLPQRHVAERSERIREGLAMLAARILEVDKQPQWRSSVRAIVAESRDADRIRYVERGAHGEVAYELRELERDRLFESRIVDTGLPYGGRWLIRLQPENGDATLVTIREEGEIHAPLYRVLGRHVFGHDASIRQYLRDLARSEAASTREP